MPAAPTLGAEAVLLSGLSGRVQAEELDGTPGSGAQASRSSPGSAPGRATGGARGGSRSRRGLRPAPAVRRGFRSPGTAPGAAPEGEVWAGVPGAEPEFAAAASAPLLTRRAVERLLPRVAEPDAQREEAPPAPKARPEPRTEPKPKAVRPPPPPPSGPGNHVWTPDRGWQSTPAEEPPAEESVPEEIPMRTVSQPSGASRAPARRKSVKAQQIQLPANIEPEQLLLALRILTQQSPEAREMFQEIQREMQQIRALIRLRESF